MKIYPIEDRADAEYGGLHPPSQPSQAQQLKHPVVNEKGHVQETLDDASAGKIAQEHDHIVDDVDADGLKRELETSHQDGYAATLTEERSQQLALNRNLDIDLLPSCVLINLCNGLDRSNLGNDFTIDLDIWPNAFNTATSLFFAAYVPLQPVSAAIVKKVGQPLFLGIIGLGWGLGNSGAKANLMTAPPYVIDTIVLLIFASLSSHFRSRIFPILGGQAIVLIGLITVIALPLSSTGGRYADLCILLAGASISSPLTVGNLGGIIRNELFLSRYGPDYHYRLKVTAGLIAVNMVGYALYGARLVGVNQWKAGKLRGMSVEEVQAEKVGPKRYADKKWTFVHGF
ncbi:MAG: hypothetical protein OHK93_004500 [Ramalina farinacea]|uniref:Uncharacterized protein n=1 Tax=Ramalina farinacea TaxID=258253 RepID=A0AA43QU88_9LECA|nr:hypothetical protein [Ramalina farinacea]